MTIFDKYQERYEERKAEEMTIQEYLAACKDDRNMYTTAQERMLKAIGEPTVVDTRKDDRLSRIFMNRKIKVYPAFKDFYGMEETIEQVVSFFKHAAQGLEESKQVLYLLGPVGGGKSSLAERLKHLSQNIPFYVLVGQINDEENPNHGKWEISPVYESPLGLFEKDEDGAALEEEYGIPTRYLGHVMSPWATKRLQEANGDVSKFKVVKMWPSILQQIGVTKVEPGDENNQDLSLIHI